MKILLINNYHFRHGGAEAVYFNTADLMRLHGHEVIFFSLDRDENDPCEQSPYFVKAIDFNCKGFINKVKGVCRYFYNKKAAKALDKLLTEQHPDVAHIHLYLGGLSVSIMEVLKRHEIPIVHSVHEYRMVCPAYTFKDGTNRICEDCGGGKFWHCLQKRCSKGNLLLSTVMTSEMFYRNTFHHPAKYVDAFVFVSKFCRDIHFIYDNQITKKFCTVLYNFCNTDVVENKRDNLNNFNSYYLYYGRLSFEKGIVTLIQAFSKYPNLKLKVVGTGPEEIMLKNKCIQEGINNIEFLGYKKGKDLYDLVQESKFVCVPSEWYENNPMTIVEAYSLNTPVIGAAIGGITEIIDDAKTGYLFESGNLQDLCKILDITTKLSKDDYYDMRKNANQFACNNFDREQHYKKLVEVYNKVKQNKDIDING